MFEKFTDNAKRVMMLANQTARQYNHEYIDSEHILMGIAKGASGVAATALKNLGVDLEKIRSEFEKRFKSGSEIVTMDKLPQAPTSKQVIECAIEEAGKSNHNYVGTEHILLGLLRKQKNMAGEHKETVARKMLRSLGLKLGDIRKEVMDLLGEPKEKSQEKETTPVLKAKEIKERPVRPEFFNVIEKTDIENKGLYKDIILTSLVDGPHFGADEVKKRIADFLSDKEFVGSNQSSVVLPGGPSVIVTKITIYYKKRE